MIQKLLQEEQIRTHHIFEKEKLPIISATPEEMYRIAEINPNLFRTKYTRWGCHFKCVKCNGYRVNTGGIRSLLQISRIVNEQKYEHRKSCKHPRWKEEWSLHRAEIAHTFVEQATDQTHTGDTNFTDISGATITSGNFTATRKYFIFTGSQHTIDSNASDGGLKTLHGSTDFAESEDQLEPTTSNVRYRIMWFTVWTAITAEAIKMQHRTSASGSTVKDDTIVLLSIEISEDLTEGSDWDFNHDSSSRSLDNTFTTDATLTIQTADHTAGDTYLVMAYGRMPTVSATSNIESRLERSGEAASTEPTASREGEDVTNGVHILAFARTFDLGASDNTFASQNRNDVGSSGTVDHSSVFAINLEKFNDSEQIYTEADLNLGTTDWADLIQTDSMTPSQTGDIFIMGAWIYDAQTAIQSGNSRLQIDNSDEPTGQSTYTTQSNSFDPTDQHSAILLTVENLDNTSHTWDLDGDVSATTGTPHAQSRQLVAFSFELAAGAPAARTTYQQIYPQAMGAI